MEQLFLETLRIAEEALSGSLKSSQALPGTTDDLVNSTPPQTWTQFERSGTLLACDLLVA